MTQLRPIVVALKRLDAATTERTRRNARLALRRALNTVWREATGDRVHCATTCPLCRIPLRTWSALVRHLRRHLGNHPKLLVLTDAQMGCPACDFRGDPARHLAALSRRSALVEHITVAAMRQTLA